MKRKTCRKLQSKAIEEFFFADLFINQPLVGLRKYDKELVKQLTTPNLLRPPILEKLLFFHQQPSSIQ
jgi:hypothetical protein